MNQLMNGLELWGLLGLLGGPSNPSEFAQAVVSGGDWGSFLYFTYIFSL